MSKIWLTQPWSVYGVYIAGMVNFAIVWDWLLWYMYRQTPWNNGWHDVRLMIFWILASKFVKLLPYFRRYPKHLLLFPGYVLFAYFHSLIKLQALLTFYNVEWSGRKIEEIQGPASTG
jgi:hypothetical protein